MISLQTVPNLTIKAKSNVVVGFTETLCVVCENNAGSVKKVDNWKIKQKMDIRTALVDATKTFPAANVDYLNNASKKTISESWTNFFKDNDPNNDWPAATWKIMKSGCGSTYTAGRLVINTSNGKITAKQNEDLGYTETVCIQGTIGSTTF